MSKGCFVDKAHQPTSEEIRAAVSGALPLWDHLIQFISQTYGGAGDLKFYGKSYGWALRFQKSGKNLLSLYPGDGCFTAQIIIGPAHVDTALGLGLGEHAREGYRRRSPLSRRALAVHTGHVEAGCTGRPATALAQGKTRHQHRTKASALRLIRTPSGRPP